MNLAHTLFFGAAVLLLLPTAARGQDTALTLNQLDQAHLESLAALTAKKIHEAKILETDPKFLVMDFFRDSTGHPPR